MMMFLVLGMKRILSRIEGSIVLPEGSEYWRRWLEDSKWGFDVLLQL